MGGRLIASQPVVVNEGSVENDQKRSITNGSATIPATFSDGAAIDANEPIAEGSATSKAIRVHLMDEHQG